MWITLGKCLLAALVVAGCTSPLDAQEMELARGLSKAFRMASEKALPSVVTIYCRLRQQEDSTILNIIGGSDDQVYDAVGSGFVVSDDGWILTNHHVIEDASRIEVRLADGRRYFSEQTLSDPASDVALVKIDPKGPLKVAEIGDSNALAVGDWVIAIGSPFTLESSVSAGIVSGTNRRQQFSRELTGQFVQTDAAINPGNSGGPLVDLDGRVVGVNTVISSRTGGFQGVGFAIPISRAMWIKNELQSYGKVRRALAGIRVSTLPYDTAQSLQLPEHAGVLVNSVVPGRPGAVAGIQAEDVIVDLAGQTVASDAEFAELVQQSPIDQDLPITVYRDGMRLELMIRLVEKP
jgi:serine protease Do